MTPQQQRYHELLAQIQTDLTHIPQTFGPLGALAMFDDIMRIIQRIQAEQQQLLLQGEPDNIPGVEESYAEYRLGKYYRE